MGKKDAVSKHYMSKNEIFADAVNFYFFDGKEKVKPEDLESGDPEELELLYGKHAAVRTLVIYFGSAVWNGPRTFAKIDMEIEEDEEEINMCRAIDEMMAEAREEGREAGRRLGEKTGRETGRKEGRESLVMNMMRNYTV